MSIMPIPKPKPSAIRNIVSSSTPNSSQKEVMSASRKDRISCHFSAYSLPFGYIRMVCHEERIDTAFSSGETAAAGHSGVDLILGNEVLNGWHLGKVWRKGPARQVKVLPVSYTHLAKDKDTDKKKKRREEQRSNAVPPSANGVSISTRAMSSWLRLLLSCSLSSTSSASWASPRSMMTTLPSVLASIKEIAKDTITYERTKNV